MGKTDVLVNKYMKDPQLFADFFNGVVYGGRQALQRPFVHGSGRDDRKDQ